ncbi:cytochrome c biogenesis protein ResB [Nocardioides aequoreus]|uniref:cytochrome c biogenesis protein ResB n=1 Tax=Nocardioides aequoreus TaxID=397278 RepID=UPI0004C3A33C|nr:cytochrome c biogenesis protein ResB [Nocardioides aequoreus]
MPPDTRLDTDLDHRASSSAPAPPPSEPPSLAPRELARWAWRQLTSMRTALLLLFLLALAAVPGSVVPQEGVDSTRVAQWQADHPRLTPVYEWLGLFSVYDSVWFSAIYMLLMVSLVGCIVPRTRVYWRGLRAQPPRTPRRLDRLPAHRSFTTDAAPEEVLGLARERLRARRYRLRRPTDDASDEAGDGSVSAERGYLREAGNLVFHLAIIVVLVGVAMGSLWGFRGSVVVVTGDGFANTLTRYDEFSAGPFFDPDDLEPFDVTIDDFDLTFIEEGRQRGMASQFRADVTYRSSPDAEPEQRELAVNHPLSVDDTDVFLIGHGYAPQITVRNDDGSVAYSGPTVFLPEDTTFRSFGVVRVPDATGADGERQQIGLEGEFYPTYFFIRGEGGGPGTAFPDARNPVVSMLAYGGDLGMDDGSPQSVYLLDKDALEPLTDDEGKPVRVDLALGQTVDLPDGLGSVSFDGLSRFVKLDVAERPGQGLALAGLVVALLGLLGSLYVRPRRLWVRAERTDDGRTLVSVAGLDRSSGGDLSGELDDLVTRLSPTPQTPQEQTP